jgi:predicted nuclease with TOPRIM domain
MAKNVTQSDVFQAEIDFLNEVRALAEDDNIPTEKVKENYKLLCDKYDRLIGEAKLLTSVSDRLHAKLNEANEKLKRQSDEINKINDDLKVNNQLLQDTIDQLVKAKVGRKASSIVLLIAILLFILSEGVLEPQVEAYFGDNRIGFIFKLGIAVLLKPIDVLVERYMMRRALKQRNNA